MKVTDNLTNDINPSTGGIISHRSCSWRRGWRGFSWPPKSPLPSMDLGNSFCKRWSQHLALCDSFLYSGFVWPCSNGGRARGVCPEWNILRCILIKRWATNNIVMSKLWSSIDNCQYITGLFYLHNNHRSSLICFILFYTRKY